MIYDLSFNADHDLFLTNGQLSFVDEQNIVKQRLIVRLQFLYGEWFLNNKVGIPYTQIIFKTQTNLSEIHEIFSTEIKNTEGVENLESLDFNFDANNRNLIIAFSVNNGLITNTMEIQI